MKCSLGISNFFEEISNFFEEISSLSHSVVFHLNAEFQRTARREKKAFLRDQCKEIEENNRMGKTGDIFKKIRDTKGTFHAKMSSIEERNCMDP